MLDSTPALSETLRQEVERQRTFAIISHPDAGKTTLTEKALLYAGAIELAGEVRGRKAARHVVSDWMEIERERGISITSAALEFDLYGRHVTLLDTPGHHDFSEDTYRTLLAVDSVVMVIDAAKGIESQTRKLFEVCRRRHLPMLTFINKLDLHSRDPFDLLDEIERVLGVSAAPMNWPIGDGDRFQGLYDFVKGEVLLYERHDHGRRRAPVEVESLEGDHLKELLGADAQQRLTDAAALIAGAGSTFDEAAYRAAEQTPVFFGSALANFGLEPFLRAIAELAPPPVARASELGGMIEPTAPAFSGFIFKIQANMNPRHRDRVAFLRVCSGELTKDMHVTNARLGSSLRLARPQRFFGRSRETVETAYAGDVVGLINPGRFAIGDTLYAGPAVRYPAIPHFPAEFFARLQLRDSRAKQFDDGVRQLEEEGLMQVVFSRDGHRAPILGVVGALQFDIIEARLRSEYRVECEVEKLSYFAARWAMAPGAEAGAAGSASGGSGAGARANAAAANAVPTLPPRGVLLTRDRTGRLVLLFESQWELDYVTRENPTWQFLSEA
jgi:peptide chain release factor 3